jgi:hypothetical protein
MMQHGRRFAIVMAVALIGASLGSSVEARDKTPYKDLPGVKVPGSEKQAQTLCTSRIERQRPSRWRNGLGYRVYRCETEIFTFKSTRPPNEVDWKKRQRYYKPWMDDGFDR